MQRFKCGLFLIFTVICNVYSAAFSQLHAFVDPMLKCTPEQCSIQHLCESKIGQIYCGQALERAYAANVLIAVTVHFDPSRTRYLAGVLKSLSTFPRADIILVTNTFEKHEIGVLQGVCSETIPHGVGGGSVSIRSYGNLSHPFNLTWCHKEIIENEFVKNSNNYTHFMYLEDDIGLDFSNFCYFVEFREILREIGLLPSFLRVEYSEAKRDFYNTDNLQQINVWRQPHLMWNDLFLVNPPNPYMACFILDKELAAEYIGSRFFRNETSECGWGVRERAAAGLCFANVPSSFQSRYVVPISQEKGVIPSCVWISHLPNNYVDNPETSHGKIRMRELVVPPRFKR